MPNVNIKLASAALFAACLAMPSQAQQSTGASPSTNALGWIGTETVKTRFGDFEFKNGYPTPAAADALLDQLKFNRAIEVYLTQIPAVAIIEIAARPRATSERSDPTRSSSGNN